MNYKILSAAMLLAGTTIGAGVFAIPYATATVGYTWGLFWLLGIGLLTVLFNYMYIYAIHRSGEKKTRQFVTYADHYLGPIGKFLATVTLVIGQWLTILAYIIGIGGFLGILFRTEGTSLIYSLGVTAIVVVLLFAKLKLIVVLEGVFTIGMISIIVMLFLVGLPHISIENISYMPQIDGLQTFLLPYGIMLGAIMGFTVLPELVQYAKTSKLSYKQVQLAAAAGTLLPLMLYVVFQFTVVGITGVNTTEEAMIGLSSVLSNNIVALGALLGSLAMFSSYVTLSAALRDSFVEDFSLRSIWAVTFTLIPPLVIYLLGLDSFAFAIEVSGVWLGTLSILLIVSMYVVSRFRKKVKPDIHQF